MYGLFMILRSRFSTTAFPHFLAYWHIGNAVPNVSLSHSQPFPAWHLPKVRPFVLTRSFFAGSHRHGAIWTGDNMAKHSCPVAPLPHVATKTILCARLGHPSQVGAFGNFSAHACVRTSGRACESDITRHCFNSRGRCASVELPLLELTFPVFFMYGTELRSPAIGN